MSTLVRETYSDHDMQCPAEWENGFKEARVLRLGDGERRASHPWTGDWTGSTFTYTLSDYDLRFRQQLINSVDRFWNAATCFDEVKMTTRANRAVLGTAYTVFVGPVIRVKPVRPLAVEVTLGDAVSSLILSDDAQLPWRVIGDGFLNELSSISESLDRDTPEPIIYGQHRRTPIDPQSPHGFEYVPTYLGIETLSAGDYHVWMIAGHAVADIPDANVIDADGLHTSIIPDEGVTWLIPHYAGYGAMFGAPYQDRHSATFGGDRRYTLIYGKVGEADPDAVVNGELTLAVFVDGVETEGDGSGDVITDRIQQYKHFLINYVANPGPTSYQSGAWLTNPIWDLFDGPVPIVEEESFDACSAIGAERMPFTGSPQDYPAGYIGAAIIGAKSGDRASVLRWIADWNRSCGVQFGVTHLGQLRVFMLHPTQDAKDAAPLYTDAYEVLKDSFDVDVRWDDQANRIPFRTDYDHTSGVYKTTGVAEAQQALSDYGREMLSEQRDYPFAPGYVMAAHLAWSEATRRQHPPRYITIEATVGPYANGDSLGYLDLGDYLRYQHFAGASDSPAEIRLAQVVEHQVQAGKRRVRIVALDCEDLIDFDAYPEFDAVSPLNETCADAIEILSEEGSQVWHLDTTAHATDDSVAGGSPQPSPPNWSGTEAFHAAWWAFTPPADGTLFLTTVHSRYDTQMAVFEGACGSPFTEVAYNDNDGLLRTSILEIPVTYGETYRILVAGYTADDGGELYFGANFTAS